MGNSRPPAAVIDLVDSYARRRNGQVEIVLADPQSPIGENPVLVLRQDQRKLKAPAQLVEDESGRRLVATLAPGNLRGTWRIALKSDAGPRVRVEARLLVQGPKRPVVLLWGRNPGPSRLPDSNRVEIQDAQPVGAARSVARKVVSVLPEKRAEQLRRQVRRLRG
ncbi:hypothetical protein ncot_01380 [Nocardioides sp. JQ2195]|uniref:hypothetical protein n=1 Tax=Nocardioides sp. JQ2195 TaxID=2592334 RepID=UPI00143E14AD|nr:hypothetical protein [Nocardioides sp. JQ2195]QIX25389.1 hypothetical protein ncot_01380 [Nocardioides sp. JQ2195]